MTKQVHRRHQTVISNIKFSRLSVDADQNLLGAKQGVFDIKPKALIIIGVFTPPLILRFSLCTVKPRYSTFQGSGQNYALNRGFHYCQHMNKYESTSWDQNLYAYWRNYVISGCVITGFHCISCRLLAYCVPATTDRL